MQTVTKRCDQPFGRVSGGDDPRDTAAGVPVPWVASASRKSSRFERSGGCSLPEGGEGSAEADSPGFWVVGDDPRVAEMREAHRRRDRDPGPTMNALPEPAGRCSSASTRLAARRPWIQVGGARRPRGTQAPPSRLPAIPGRQGSPSTGSRGVGASRDPPLVQLAAGHGRSPPCLPRGAAFASGRAGSCPLTQPRIPQLRRSDRERSIVPPGVRSRPSRGREP